MPHDALDRAPWSGLAALVVKPQTAWDAAEGQVEARRRTSARAWAALTWELARLRSRQRDEMRLVRSIASAAETVLAQACWLAPGPRCPRNLLASLGAVVVAGSLGAVLYLLWR